MFYRFFAALFFCAIPLFAENFSAELLQRDLHVVQSIDEELKDTLPFVYDSSLSGGYLNMPSARMQPVGMIAIGGVHLPPYNIFSVNLQPFSRIELVANYRIYYGVPEYNMGCDGFGDDADRGMDVKVALLTPQDGFYFLPEISLGAQDFIGSKRFEAYYMVGTYQIHSWNLEVSLGYGIKRIDGLFAGAIWSPFRSILPPYADISFIAEYDATDYEKNSSEHYAGRHVSSRWNGGIALTFFEFLQMKVSSQRGEKTSFMGSMYYNFGQTPGLFAKKDDPKLPSPSRNVSCLYPDEREFAKTLAENCKQQGFDVHWIELSFEKEKTLIISMINLHYRDESVVRERIERLLAAIIPDSFARVIVIIEANGIPVSSYSFRTIDLLAFRNQLITLQELEAVAPMKDPSTYSEELSPIRLYYSKQSPWQFTFRPRLLTFFGSSTGKFKYSFGLLGGANGYIADQLYYDAAISFTIKASIYDMKDYDYYNPSQLLNVRTDAIRYLQEDRFHLDHFYLQKGWSLPEGWYFRSALGYFEPMYGGAAVEALYYPAHSCFAVGIEAASVLKRTYNGIGFTTQIRKLNGYTPEYVHFIGYQYFLDLYYTFKPLNIDLSAKIGSFLARDKGARFEATRNFKSGMKLTFWYSWTNANDIVNGHVYHDKGFGLFLPLDIFLPRSSRSYIGEAMSFWLRDCGAVAMTGKRLYPTLHEERLGYVGSLY